VRPRFPQKKCEKACNYVQLCELTRSCTGHILRRVQIPHKDLQLILDSILRFATLRQNVGLLIPFAVVLSNEGRIVQLDGGCGESQEEQTRVRVIEAGLLLMARQGKCKAIGLCLDPSLQQTSRKGIQVVLEHQDGTAYRILFPWIEGGAAHLRYGNATVLPSGSKFFANRVSLRVASAW
jgi:hypothetical protein